MEFINRLEQLLRDNHMTAKELTERLEIGRTTINDWKRGKSTPSPNILIGITQIFGVSIDYLLTGQAPAPSDLTPEQKEWLSLLDKLDPIKKAEFKGEIKGYLKAKCEFGNGQAGD